MPHKEVLAMNKKTKRFSQLIDLLQANEAVSVQYLADCLGVSTMTIRRDLDELQEQHIVERSHGKAALCQGKQAALYENIEDVYNLSHASGFMSEQKSRIAKYAASIIHPDDVVILDNGSTTDRIPDYIPADMAFTAVSYNLNILVKLINRPNTKIIFAGGHFHPSDQMFESAENIHFLSTIRAHKLFVSASGVHSTLGMTCAHDFEVSVKQTVLQSSLMKILVADSSKFGTLKTVHFANMDVLDMIITDTGLSEEWADIIRSKGIDLVMV